MLLHLEYGVYCNSSMDFDAGWISQFYDGLCGLPFACPECEATFRSMSGLFQHAESDRCDVGTGYGTQLGNIINIMWSYFKR